MEAGFFLTWPNYDTIVRNDIVVSYKKSGMSTGIAFRKISKSYGSALALAEFSLTLAPGEFVTLLGPSGSGKTTALNVLAGFVAPSSGELEIDGQSVLHLPPEHRNLGMVFQSYSLFPHLNIYDNVAFPLRLRKTARHDLKRCVEEALEMVQLGSFGQRMPSQLSGGQRQRIALARAVVSRPSVLLMDEPLGALDLKLRQAMQREIKRLHRQLDCTILFVTHDQGEALAMSDRVVVMNHARIEQIGTPHEIYDKPRNRHVAEFIGTTNLLELARNGDGTWALPQIGVDRFALAESVSAPEPTLLSIRPERLRRDAVHRADLSFDAQVVDVTFLGDVTEYTLRARSGQELHVREPRSSATDALERGATSRFAFNAAEASALR